ncbi:MAG: ATP-dependent DNA helicase UvrD2 [Acidimicrobiales bacterium]
MERDRLLSGLNSAQVEAVTTGGAPVVVLAGAGSGKTRVLTRRIAWRVVTGETDPNRVMALTFTRKAADELRHRIAALGLRDRVPAGTFHGMALLQLRQRWAERGITPPALLDRKVRFVAQLLPSGGRRRVDALDVTAEIDWARARLVGPDHYGQLAIEAGRTPPLPAEEMAELIRRYQQEKQRRRVVDFDDLLMLAIRDLADDGSYADAVRWRYRHLYVDEFQDVNPLQYELLRHWRGDGDDLFVVGDPNQAIYGWNGADPQLLSTFVRREPGSTVIELTENYRSTPQVLALASTLASGSPLLATRPDGPTPTISAHADDRAEAAGVAERVRAAQSGGANWSDQAVLVRTNAQLLLLEQALRAADVPIRLRNGSGPLAAPEVRSELARLGRPASDLRVELDDLRARVEDLGTDTVPEIERRANLAALARLVDDYVTTDANPNGPGLLAWVATVDAADVDADTDAVELATFHGSKGLEWPVVHIAGLEEGFVPIAYATTGAQLAEERRLLYVALTRSMNELHLSWAAHRTFTTSPVRRRPSPLLGSLADAVKRLGVGPSHRVDWRRALARSRQSLAEHLATPEPAATAAGSPGGRAGTGRGAGVAVNGHDEDAPPDATYRALTEWRLRRARAADVPAHVVFNDHTLRAVATARPATRTALAGLPGMRPAKLARYGDDLLRVVAETRR